MFSRCTCTILSRQLIRPIARLGHGIGQNNNYRQLQLRKTKLLCVSPPPVKSLFLEQFRRHKSVATTAVFINWRTLLNKLFGKYLLLTNTISSGVLMVIGDFICQELQFQCTGACPTKYRYDWERCGRMFLVGAMQGPLHHYVYNWMDRIMPARSLRNIGKKILIDQLVMSPICILMFFYAACALEDKSIKETNTEMLQKFPYIYATDWAIWPAAQYVNFRYLDTKYRVMYVNVVTALYNVFISFMKHEFEVDV